MPRPTAVSKKERLDHVDTEPAHPTRRGTIARDRKPARLDASLQPGHCRRNLTGAAMGGERPGERQQIAPMAVRREQRGDGARAPVAQGRLQRSEPALNNGLLVFDGGSAQNRLIGVVHG
jgi:hypothetical protein